jgi:formylglycine-generating enzyme required for sulfatase activity
MGSPDVVCDDPYVTFCATPVHGVTVPPFQMAKTEVTFCEYRSCVAAGTCTAPHVADGTCWVIAGAPMAQGPLPESLQGDDQPAVCIDWNQSRQFCEWAGGRLCTEAEWEFAARNWAGAGDTDHPWVKGILDCHHAVYNAGHAPDCSCAGAACATCLRPEGNDAWGVCDLIGNVGEWLQDCFLASYDGAPSDGSAMKACGAFSETRRVIRGGSYAHEPFELSSTQRFWSGVEFVASFLGARCCRSP